MGSTRPPFLVSSSSNPELPVPPLVDSESESSDWNPDFIEPPAMTADELRDLVARLGAQLPDDWPASWEAAAAATGNGSAPKAMAKAKAKAKDKSKARSKAKAKGGSRVEVEAAGQAAGTNDDQ